MDTAEVQVGSTITNGSSALRITERVERDRRWGTPSWKGLSIPLEEFGGNPGTTDTVPDYLLGSWRHVPFEWAPVVGGGLEERYVWSADWRRLQREVRRTVQPTVDGIRGHRIISPELEEERRALNHALMMEGALADLDLHAVLPEERVDAPLDERLDVPVITRERGGMAGFGEER